MYCIAALGGPRGSFFLHAVERPIISNFKGHIAASPEYIATLIQHRAALYPMILSTNAVNGEVSKDDIYLFATLHAMSIARGIVYPPAVEAYRVRMAERTSTADDRWHRKKLGDSEAMVDAAAAGVDLCQVPVRERLDCNELEAVLTQLFTVSGEVHAVWPRRAHLTPRVRHVVDRLIVEAAKGTLR